MSNRLLEKVTVFFSLILVLISGSAWSQALTSISDFPNTICPETTIYPSINVSEVQAIDSIFLAVKFNPQHLRYQSFRQVNTLLNQNGNASIAVVNGNTVVFTWDARPGQFVTISDSKLLDLIFITVDGNDTLYIDESVSIYRDTSGTIIPMTYEGTRINLFQRMSVVIEELDATCPGECDANLAVYVTGGIRPYEFLLNGNASPLDSIFTDVCSASQLIQVTDANNCTIDSLFNVSVLDSATVTLLTDPDTVYMQNPVVYFSFEADDSVVDWYWNFGDNTPESRELAPVHLYSGAANPNIDGFVARLITVSESGCTKVDSVLLTISELPVFIPNVFTPNEGDLINNYFQIAKKLSDSEKVAIDSEYIRMELTVFDRWGRKVYENLNYRNNWDGDKLPEGTYYYRLNTFGYYKNESFKGAVTILR